MRPQVRSLVLGGLLPVAAYMVIEEIYGLKWGLVAGMVLGIGEILWEKRKQGRVDGMTWAGNGALLVLGGVSLATQEGVWFKLQPALLEGVIAVALLGSVLLGRPAMIAMAEKQGTLATLRPELKPLILRAFTGMTWRMGLFFALHAGLATWAALYLSTEAWALLKGVGFTASLILYWVAELGLLRYRIRKYRPENPL